MKKWICMILALALVLAGCTAGGQTETTGPVDETPEGLTARSSGQTPGAGETVIILSDEEITIDVEKASDPDAVFVERDIVYYEAGQDFTYGEGEPGDEHTTEEAAEHKVVHITKPGTYRITGKISAGQIAVDLGEDAKNDPNAVVTLILDGADITCTVAPAVIFYNVYECGVADEETASATVDTSAAGANVLLAEGSVNIVNGSYVARIYKPGTVELSEDGTEVEDAKKLHKYDAAFYSKMSMNVDGEGVLAIFAENEGLDSELHLTINGGDIRIRSGNDGINTNEDNVSVTTVNGGSLTITVTGETGEGDGIDSNGYLVINGGTVIASACGFSGDAGIDSDLGIYLNGGTVVASGNMLDAIAGGENTYAVFQFTTSQKGGSEYILKNETGEEIFRVAPENSFSCLILSSKDLTPGNYSLWKGETRLSGTAGNGGFGMPGEVPGKIEIDPPEGEYELPPQPTMPVTPQGGTFPGNPPQGEGDGTPPEMPEGETWPGGNQMQEFPDGENQPEGGQRPEGGFGPGMGQGMPGMGGFGQMMPIGQTTDTFVFFRGGNYFMVSA